jgi:signal transduction histidine kinase
LATAVATAASAQRVLARAFVTSALAVTGGAAAVGVAFHVGDSPVRAPDRLSFLRGVAVALYVLAGTYTSWRRPGARFGFYLTGIGLFFSVCSLAASHHELTHSIGRVTFGAFSVCLAYVFLVFPHDRLASRIERRVMAALAASSIVLWVVTVPLVPELPAAGPLTDCSPACPGNAFQVLDVSNSVLDALADVTNIVVGAGLLAVAALLLAKARSPAHLRRRLVGPLLLCASLQAVTYSVFSALRQFGATPPEALRVVGIVTALAVPVAMLVGQLRGHVIAATSLGQLVARVAGKPVTAEGIEQMLRSALGDPVLRLALWEPARETYVDVHGEAVKLPSEGGDLTVTSVSREGKRVAALVHDVALEEASGINEGLAATSLLLLENSALVQELQASRRRIVTTAQKERLRLERNLHDGAQQRLFAIQMKLDTVRQEAADPRLADELADIADDASAAVDELRVLAQGLYPTVLRERGLADAMRVLARSASVLVDVVERGVGRYVPEVEEAVYFCVREAIQNSTKHGASDTRATINLESRGGRLEVTVADDGPGFDTRVHGTGMGLLSMHDRIGAVGGKLEIRSAIGRGTTVRAVVPIERPQA